jgi:peptidoglycan/LPS O-acetylase OafA/YrhL
VDASSRGAVGNSHFPGFDGLRLAAAISVLFSHAFLIAQGTEDGEPLHHLLGPGNIIGLYGVFTFFIISGFLLTSSLASGAGVVQFSINRFLRIVPGFLFCIVATSLLIGALVTPLALRSYIKLSRCALERGRAMKRRAQSTRTLTPWRIGISKNCAPRWRCAVGESQRNS